MLKILLALLLMTTPAWAITNQWRGGVGTNELDGTQAANLIGYNSYNHIVQPLDNLLSGYCTEYLQYNSSSLINVVAGSCNVSNSQGTIHLFLQDTSNTVLSSSNLDTGSITASTTYYVYATAATNAATTSTYYISASNTAPSGQTYYYQIGSFTTDSSSNFTSIVNNTWDTGYVGSPTSKSVGVIYQALTDGQLQVNCNCEGAGGNPTENCSIVSDSSSSPSTGVGGCGSSSSTTQVNVWSYPNIRKGNYYEVTGSSVGAINFVSTGK